MLRRLLRRRPPKNPLSGTLIVDDDGVVFHRTYTTEAVRWDELVGVDVMTTDDGPAVEDVYWVLLGESDIGAVIPQGIATDELVERLMALPGFDFDAMTHAMGSTGGPRGEEIFRCWRAPGSTI